MSIWAVVPARGGSKGIPGKNLANLGDMPLIGYVIAAGLRSSSIDRLLLSTEDQRIAEVGESLGAEVPFYRPAELAADEMPTIPCIQHILTELQSREGTLPEMVVLLQPTSPFVRPEQIDQAVTLLKANPHATAVTSVTELDHVCHPYSIRQRDEHGWLKLLHPDEAAEYPTRQAKPVYYACGNVYVTRTDTILNGHSFTGERCLPMVVDKASCIDIDTPEDLLLAEYIVRGKAALKQAQAEGATCV